MISTAFISEGTGGKSPNIFSTFGTSELKSWMADLDIPALADRIFETMRRTFLILILLTACPAQKLRFSPVEKAIILARAGDIPSSGPERLARMKELFLESGCLTVTEQGMPSSETPNLICRLNGGGEGTIIVGANYGQVSPDNWAGASLLPSLYQSLAARKRRHTFIFVAFADERKTSTGAQFFAAHMTDAEVKHSQAMIDLDALGLSPTKFWAAHSDKSLVKALVVVMYALKLPASQVNIAKAGEADSEAFASRHIPQITLHSLTREAVAVMHNQQDPAQKFRPNNYYDSYHLISGYLAYLDETLKSRPTIK